MNILAEIRNYLPGKTQSLGRHYLLLTHEYPYECFIPLNGSIGRSVDYVAAD